MSTSTNRPKVQDFLPGPRQFNYVHIYHHLFIFLFISIISTTTTGYVLQLPEPNVPDLYHQQQQPLKPTSPIIDSSNLIESNLPIRIRNNGGEIFREMIASNPEHDYIRIEFEDTDGSLIKQLIDFRNNLQIFRLVRLGEQDLNEQKVQTFCFVTRLPENEYISSDAMSKLTQKNPSTIRTAELDHGTELYEMDLEIRYDGPLTLLSQHLNKFCQQAERRIYASEKDLKLWTSSIGNRSYWNLTSSDLLRKLNIVKSVSTQGESSTSNAQTPLATNRKCGELLSAIYHNITNEFYNQQTSNSDTTNQTNNSMDQRRTINKQQSESKLTEFFQAYRGMLCECTLSLVIPFYPCSVKYCQTNDPNDGNKLISYRCGIKTCRKRYEFRFTVADKLFCLSDFDPSIVDKNNNDINVNAAKIVDVAVKQVENGEPIVHDDSEPQDQINPYMEQPK